MQKRELRRKMLKERVMIEAADVASFSAIIKDKLLALGCIKKASCVMAYYSYKNEPNLLPFINECLGMGKRVALPYIAGEGELIAVNYNFDTMMKSNIYGIPEPVIMNESEREEPDVIIVPGIAFDFSLNRVGFGGGYYDRFLLSTNAAKIGTCFDCQIVDGISTEAHDVPMDMVITEKRILGAKGCA